MKARKRPLPVFHPNGTVSLPLARPGSWTLIDRADFAHCSKYRWFKTNGYAATNDEHGKHRYLHRMICVTDKQVDHKDRDPLNNTRANLRPCTESQNKWNAERRSNTSGFKGVYWWKTRRKWRAVIGFYGKKTLLGNFDTAIEAARAYDARARELHGEFAVLNGVEPL